MDAEYVKLATVFNLQGKEKEAIETFKIAVDENAENQSAQFFLVLTLDKYYKDINARIKLFEDFKKKFPKSYFRSIADKKLVELKEEKHMKTD